MSLIADALLIAAALGAGFYCFVLSRRLRRFTDLEKGMGGAVAVLSVQVEDMKTALTEAQKTAGESAARLEETTLRAEDVARRMEFALASTHASELGAGEGAFAAGRQVRRKRRLGREIGEEEAVA